MSVHRPPFEAFDGLADRYGCPQAKALPSKERHAVLRRYAANGCTAQAFVSAAIRSLKTLQRRRLTHADREEQQRLARALRTEKRRGEEELLRSLSKPVSRIAGQAEHLRVLANLPADIFYRTPEWRRTRWEALALYGRRCVSCGAVPADEGRLTATHITPRLVRPELAFDLSNLRILCADCHVGQRALRRPPHA
jgi:5-methylcytosine-specific restriction endonuclease McrA